MDEKTRYALETILYGKLEAKKRRRIRKRASYAYWKDFLTNDLRGLSLERKERIARKVFAFMDARRAFGYATNAMYFEESLELCLEDLRNESENRE